MKTEYKDAGNIRGRGTTFMKQCTYYTSTSFVRAYHRALSLLHPAAFVVCFIRLQHLFAYSFPPMEETKEMNIEQLFCASNFYIHYLI